VKPDAVLSYHLSPMTCGVAKFNCELARLLEVPCLSLFEPGVSGLRRPLLSLKVSEFLASDLARLEGLLATLASRSYDVFFHDFGGSPLERALALAADRLYCANSELRARLAALRADTIELWCPGTLLEREPLAPTELSVFSFGMAHKVRLDHYLRLAELLAATGRTSSLLLSTALHDNSSYDGSFTRLLAELRGVFGSGLYFLGFLSDRAIAHHLAGATYFAAFFERGVRANNTSVHVAMQQGAVVITNLDAHAPAGFRHLETVIDIREARALPTSEPDLAAIRARARTLAQAFGWETLVTRLQ
jgi:hypothetical protein